MSSSNGRLVAVVVLVLVSIPLVLVAVVGGSDGGGGLRVERDQQGLVVYVEDREKNRPETANGRKSVTFECLDPSDEVVVRRPTPWPLPDTDGGQLPSHSHAAIPPEQLGRIVSCRLAGTEGPLEGDVAAR
jgi:hypothetical protein